MNSTQPGGEAPLRQERVLCAHPISLVGDALVRLLSIDGFNVQQATVGAQALESYRNEGKLFKGAIVAHELPEMGGVAFVSSLRDEGFKGRIIVHGSVVSEEDTATYRSLGVESIIATMKGPDELLGVVAAWFEAGSGFESEE